MRFFLLRSLLAVFTLLCASVCLNASVKAGQPAPEFSITDIEGLTHSLARYSGKIVVLEWVNPQCPFVVHHYEKTANIPTLQKQAIADGVIWLLINSGHAGAQGDFSTEQVHAWLEKTGASPTAYVRDQSGALGHLFGAKTTPHFFIINAAGVLVYQGAIDDARGFDVAATKAARNFPREVLQALKAGSPVPIDAKEPYGCSVKY